MVQIASKHIEPSQFSTAIHWEQGYTEDVIKLAMVDFQRASATVHS